ncbi:L-seryl-tRNA(Sec) kinase [Lucilia sericata]|uniref:L-seryl-tRNA(Sec) kinase n=1 Tax=Lucilia sericata TaxID=13632 RepID=UPI0018A87609|nr:L-seryl-tRNA(Sec) kinase [Lucilia sericata]
MNRICLVALIGLPAVGKTTLCHHLTEMESLPFNVLHLCYDCYVNFNLENPTQYKEQREQLLQTLSTIINNFKNSHNLTTELITLSDFYRNHQHKDVVILCDDNHYYRSMRYKLYQLAREQNIGFCQIYLETSLDLALERNSLRSGIGKVPNNVIVEMSKRLEVPNASVYKWEENTFILRNFDRNNISQDIVAYVTQFLDVPVQPLQLSVPKTQTPQSVVHELDLLMRKRISTLIYSEVEKNKKTFAKKLNDLRKEILKQFQLDLNDNFEKVDLNKYVERLK